MSAFTAVVKRHAVAFYFVLTIAISWTGLVAVVGPGGLPLSWQRFERLGPILYFVALAGPFFAGILMTVLTSGRTGLRDILRHLRRWRVGVRWYVVAFLPTLVLAAVYLALAIFSPDYVPTFVTTDGKAGFLLITLAISLLFGFFEEIGWTGFAVPRLLPTHGVVAAGVVVGLVWGVWHFPLFWESDSFSGALPIVILVGRLIFWLPAFRVLMVWVYDRTESLLLAVLMHASLVAAQLTVTSQGQEGAARLIGLVALGAALWLFVVAVVVANHRHGKRPLVGAVSA
ncbi:MAG: type II CAAX prenyl endopeptidase Rce1 family protein [Caldilineaceae bacterium]